MGGACQRGRSEGGELHWFLPGPRHSVQTGHPPASCNLQGESCDSHVRQHFLTQYFLPQFRLYKGCYQLMAGANPMQAQAMLNSTGHASFLRKRGSGKVGEGCGVFVCASGCVAVWIL